jgi:MFS family permease
MDTSINVSRISPGLLSLPVIIAALGYFVDIYDLTVFSILRIPSLRALGLTDTEISSVGINILNWQLTGIIIGGIIWGIIGDKYGRRFILFGSIALYSIANLACAFVQDTTSYAAFRFIAGIGLAGELGAGITLVSELLPKNKRSYATSIVTGFGLLGAACAYMTYELLDWRNTYIVGSILGILLLLLRSKVLESGLFEKIKRQSSLTKGNFFSLLFSKKASRYFTCIGIALPIYYFFGLLVAFSNEIAKALNLAELIVPGKCIMYYYIGLAIGDFFSGPLSQAMKSRKKIIGSMMVFTLMMSIYILYGGIGSALVYYIFCFVGGIATGYWAMFMVMTSETFGTNLRASATTSAPNMVRGALILMTIFYKELKPEYDVLTSAAIVGLVTFIIAFVSLFFVKETFNKDLDFNE